MSATGQKICRAVAGAITAGGAKAARFKDPEGDILAIIESVDR